MFLIFIFLFPPLSTIYFTILNFCCSKSVFPVIIHMIHFYLRWNIFFYDFHIIFPFLSYSLSQHRVFLIFSRCNISSLTPAMTTVQAVFNINVFINSKIDKDINKYFQSFRDEIILNSTRIGPLIASQMYHGHLWSSRKRNNGTG